MKETLIELIRQEGPLSVARYMELALTHPTLGYYTSRLPLGAQGDFITAPEISQLFGELIGLWFLDLWESSGCPSDITLLELGPGRGILMKDCLRVFALRPPFLKSLKIILFEVSPTLRSLQQETLQGFPVQWVSSLEEIRPTGSLYALANEFLDALPLHQYVKTSQGWQERCVQEHQGTLQWTLGKINPSLDSKKASLGTIYEESPQTLQVFQKIVQMLSEPGSGALFIDYGYTEPGYGDTFQAVQNHRPVGVLDNPGQADLTAHVNFRALQEKLRAFPSLSFSLTTQREFLLHLGLTLRLSRLKQKSTSLQAHDLEQGASRLIDPAQMGTLFKVLALRNLSTPS